jgi:hypothetical protein
MTAHIRSVVVICHDELADQSWSGSRKHLALVSIARAISASLRDLTGSDTFLLTQELMAHMMGARRNAVSIVANTLQRSNYIR